MNQFLTVRFTVMLAICSLLAISCKKAADFSKPPIETEHAESFKKLTVSDNFNWKNDRMVSLSVQPLQMTDSIFNTLRIKIDGNPTAIYSVLTSMNQAHKASFKVPSHVQEVTISFGSISKLVPITNNNLAFDFYPEN